MILCLEVLVDYTESVDFWVYGRALKCTRSGPTWQNMLCDGYTVRIRHSIINFKYYLKDGRLLVESHYNIYVLTYSTHIN